MGAKTLRWAFNQDVGDPVAKIVLLTLAFHYNDNSGLCYPSKRTIAKAANCTAATVKRKLSLLAEGGWISRQYRFAENGRQTSSAYKLSFDKDAEAETMSLKDIPYFDYLLTDHWIETRRKKLKEAGHRCQVCNTSGKPEVHHRTYERRSHEKMEDLTVLCSDCHTVFHKRNRLVKEVA